MPNEKVIVRRLPEPESGHGWAVSVIRASGAHRGKEHCLALLCGGTVGKVLAVMCARQIAESMMIDDIEVDPDLATTEN